MQIRTLQEENMENTITLVDLLIFIRFNVIYYVSGFRSSYRYKCRYRNTVDTNRYESDATAHSWSSNEVKPRRTCSKNRSLDSLTHQSAFPSNQPTSLFIPPYRFN